MVPRETHDTVYRAMLDVLDLLPAKVVTLVVLYYNNVQAVANFAADLSTPPYAQISTDRRAQMYRRRIGGASPWPSLPIRITAIEVLTGRSRWRSRGPVGRGIGVRSEARPVALLRASRRGSRSNAAIWSDESQDRGRLPSRRPRHRGASPKDRYLLSAGRASPVGRIAANSAAGRSPRTSAIRARRRSPACFSLSGVADQR